MSISNYSVSNAMGSLDLTRAVAILVTVWILLAIAVFNADAFPRGSDQFWYVADAQSVASGVYETNNIFPNSFANDERQSKGRPFVQNRPMVYIAGVLVKISINPVSAYRIINLVSLLGIFIFVIKTLEMHEVGLAEGLLVCAFIVSFPAVVFSLFQPLTQLFDSFLFVATWYFLLKIREKVDFGYELSLILLMAAASVSSVILILQRPDFKFLLIILGVCLMLPFENIHQLMRRLISSFILLCMVFCGMSFVIIPEHLQTRISTLTLVTNGSSLSDWGNMVLYFADDHFLSKHEFTYLLKIRFLSLIDDLRSINILSTPTIGFLFVSFVLLLRNLQYKINRHIVIGSLGLLGSFFMLIFSFQYQYRYAIFLVPILAISVTVSRPKFIQELFKENHKILIYLGFLLMSLLVAFFSMRQYNAEVKRMHDFIRSMPSATEVDGDILVSYSGGGALFIGYVYPNSRVYYATPLTVKAELSDEVGLIFDKDNILLNAKKDIFKKFHVGKKLEDGWVIWVKK